MSKAAVANLLVRANAFALVRFLNRSKLPVLMYHRFSEDEEFGKTSRQTFERHLRYLKQHYSIISLTEAATRLCDRQKLPDRAAVITVDDGYDDFFDIAFPVLTSFKVPATLYVVTEFVGGSCWIWTDKARFILRRTLKRRLSCEIGGKVFDKELTDADSRLNLAGAVNAELKKLPDETKDTLLDHLAELLEVEIPGRPPGDYSALDWEKARALADSGIEIGSHTSTHPILTNVDGARLEKEFRESKAVIESEIGIETVHFCYPNGNVSGRERDAAEAAGYASAVTTEIRLCENLNDPFLIPRIDAEPEMHRFVQSTSGFDRLKK